MDEAQLRKDEEWHFKSTQIAFVDFFNAAQRLRCASAIRLRPAVLMRWCFFELVGAALDLAARAVMPSPESSARACLSRSISASMEDSTSSKLIMDSVPDDAGSPSS